ncbi:hypothetical protein ACIQFU_09505 [Streptomyces sp. NPDC093065]|uniref:hypothetical protein n=1 Tax=Streptomyces sp. NPDC093065 TaxID=3366021 RepID=UPI00382E1A51
MATAGTNHLTGIGARTIPGFDGVHGMWPRGDRPRSVRAAAETREERFKALRATELAPWKRFWPVVPTCVHGGIAHGETKGGGR